jgi:hypothetical protein
MKEIDIFERNLTRLKKGDGNLDIDEAKLIHYLKKSKDVDGFEDRVSRYKSFLMFKAGEKMASVIILPIIQVVVIIISGLAIAAISNDSGSLKNSLYLLPYIIGATTLIQIGLYLSFISKLVSAGRYLKEFGKCYQI